MTEQRFSNIWDALEDTPEAAENMKLRSSLLMALQEHLTAVDITQTQAAELFGVTQPRVSDLMRGKIDRFSLDALVKMATTAGLQVEMRVLKRA